MGTCIVIHRATKKIVIGADSRRVMDVIVEGGQGTHQVQGEDWCKIKQSGKYYFALAGIGDEEQVKVAERACRKGKNLDDVASIFKSDSEKKAIELINKYKSYDPVSFKERFANHPKLNDICFFGFERGEASTVTLHSTLTIKPNENIEIKFVEYKNIELSLLGIYKNIVALPKQDVMNNLRVSPVETIKLLVELEANYAPLAVGPPIDILELRASGPVWHAKKPNCP